MDYLEIRELYHSLQVDEERRRFLSEFDIYNRDFLDDLPPVVRDTVESLKWRFKQEDWFLEAWEKYRQHVLEAGLGGAIKMPGYVFKPYLERYFDEHPERFGLLNNNCGECAYSDLDIGDYLEHHGIKGQKWGIRRYQNEDGSLTAEGKARYGTVENLNMEKRKKRTRNLAIAGGVLAGTAAVAAGAYVVNRKVNAEVNSHNLRVQALERAESSKDKFFDKGHMGYWGNWKWKNKSDRDNFHHYCDVANKIKVWDWVTDQHISDIVNNGAKKTAAAAAVATSLGIIGGYTFSTIKNNKEIKEESKKYK